MELRIALAVWLFALVHIDTLVMLVAFCTDEQYELPEILIGHYVGFSIGLFAAVAGALVLADLLADTAFLLGIVPIILGIWMLTQRRQDHVARPVLPARGPVRRALVVAGAGVGVSGENIAVFVPVFIGLQPVELATVVVSYLILAGVVFVVAWEIGTRLLSARIPRWIDTLLVPGTLMLVGVYVLVAGLIAA